MQSQLNWNATTQVRISIELMQTQKDPAAAAEDSLLR